MGSASAIELTPRTARTPDRAAGRRAPHAGRSLVDTVRTESERDIVLRDRLHRRLVCDAHGRRRTLHRSSSGSAACAAELCDTIRLDLRGVALVAILVVPLARLQAAF